ncbi:MAG: PorV/PorQ family protein [Bacteroidetes bacterium]|nr:PorV/PorQ family protein [Bacteroidota bacterium]MDA0875249.1 PorV/PorQ family protein [Bacteroidota bacterium]
MTVRFPLLFFFLLLAVTSASGLRAQDSGLSFLTLGMDAEALARGDAGVAGASGAFATTWNPAGLARSEGSVIGVSHHVWIADIRTYAASGAFSLGKRSGLGVFVTATGAGNLEARDQPGESAGLFDAQFVAAGAALGQQLGPIRAGVAIKFLSERIYTNSANGYGFDVGVQTDIMNGSILLGATYSNLGSMEELNVEATELPRTLRVGAEIYPFRAVTALDGELFLSMSLLAEVSRNFVTERTQWHFGTSAEVLETVTARIGYLSNDFLRDFSAGVGIEVADLMFDYAVLPFEDGFGGPAHILTLRYGF